MTVDKSCASVIKQCPVIWYQTRCSDSDVIQLECQWFSLDSLVYQSTGSRPKWERWSPCLCYTSNMALLHHLQLPPVFLPVFLRPVSFFESLCEEKVSLLSWICISRCISDCWLVCTAATVQHFHRQEPPSCRRRRSLCRSCSLTMLRVARLVTGTSLLYPCSVCLPST